MSKGEGLNASEFRNGVAVSVYEKFPLRNGGRIGVAREKMPVAESRSRMGGSIWREP